MSAWPLSPYLTVTDAAAAIAFYGKAFGATERFRLPSPDGARIVHAELDIHGIRLMLSDDVMGEGRTGSGAVVLHLEVPDSDALQAKAEAAGATVTMPVADTFWGARYGRLLDPYGMAWSISTQIREASIEEMQAAVAQMCRGK